MKKKIHHFHNYFFVFLGALVVNPFYFSSSFLNIGKHKGLGLKLGLHSCNDLRILMIRFDQPHFLLLLWLLPLWAAGWWWFQKKRRQALQQFADHALLSRLTAHHRPGTQWLSRVMMVMAFGATVAGLAQPQQAVMGRQAANRGLDILFLADCSASMGAEDAVPTRLERAKRAMTYLIDHLQGDRIGLIQCAGEAFMTCPFTDDKGALRLVVDAMTTNSLPVAGTALDEGLRLGLDSFERNGAKNSVMVLFSDGEDFGASIGNKLRKARAEGVRLYVMGVGTPRGVGLTVQGKVMKDRRGKPVITKLNQKQLARLADAGGGIYWRLADADNQTDRLVAELNRLEKIKRFTSGYYRWRPLYPWLALLAALLVGAALLLNQQKNPRRLARTAMILLMLGLPLAGHSESYRGLMHQGLRAFKQNDMIHAQQAFDQARLRKPQSALTNYNLGCSLLAQQKLMEAYQAFSRARTSAHAKLRQAVLYNLGYTAFYLGLQQGDPSYWQEAFQRYKELLIEHQNDDDARYNIEIILREIKKRSRTTAPQQRQRQGQNQGQQEGSGADKPGQEQAQSQGRPEQQAPPQERQEQSEKRQDQGHKPKTSEEQQGRRQKGMSQDEALRTLRSLEAEENSIQKQWPDQADTSPEYKGPPW